MVKDYNLRKECPGVHPLHWVNHQYTLVSPLRDGLPSERDLSTPLSKLPQPSTEICLALGELHCFETVDTQFQHWGIQFVNAIALQPSNPAFGADSAVALMGAPKSGWLEIHFQIPIRQIEAQVMSPRTTILSMYGSPAAEQAILQTEMTLVGTRSPEHPVKQFRSELSRPQADINKVTFYTFDGQLVINQLFFKF